MHGARWPVMTLARERIHYGVGSTNNPTDPFGHSDLVIEVDGNAKLVQSTRSGFAEWTGRVVSSALDALWQALDEAVFPVPLQNMPAGSALRVLTIGTGAATKSALIAYHAIDTMPGYREAFWILDSIIRQLSEDTVPAVPPYGSQIVAAITRLPKVEPVSLGTAFAIACLSARHVAHAARLELVERHATDPKLAHAIEFSRRALKVEASTVAESDARLANVAGAAGISLPPMPSPEGLAAWLATLNEVMRPHMNGPLQPVAWLTGELGLRAAVSAELLAHIAYLRCAAPENADLSGLASERARELRALAAALTAHLGSMGVPHVASHANSVEALVGCVTDLEPTVAEGYRQLNELVAAIYKSLDDKIHELDTPL